jgi:hypothetical protein
MNAGFACVRIDHSSARQSLLLHHYGIQFLWFYSLFRLLYNWTICMGVCAKCEMCWEILTYCPVANFSFIFNCDFYNMFITVIIFKFRWTASRKSRSSGLFSSSPLSNPLCPCVHPFECGCIHDFTMTPFLSSHLKLLFQLFCGWDTW